MRNITPTAGESGGMRRVHKQNTPYGNSNGRLCHNNVLSLALCRIYWINMKTINIASVSSPLVVQTA